MTLKKYLFTTLILSSILFFSACADKDKSDTSKSKAKDIKANEIADKMCKIAKDIGITDMSFDNGLSDEEEDQMKKKAEQNKDKILSLLEEVDSHIKTLNKNQKVQFSKELMKEIIDSYCGNTLFNYIPFDKWPEFYEEARKELKRDREERRDIDASASEDYEPAYAPAPYEDGESEY
jgi:hypothetical protein